MAAFLFLAARRSHLMTHSFSVRGQDALWGTVYALMGWVIATRRHRNPIGWIFLAIGVSAAASAFAGALQTDLPLGGSGSPWGADVGAWLQQWVWVPSYVLVTTFVLLLFPDGTLPTSRFRWVRVIGAGALGAMLVGGILSPDNSGPGFHNPVGVLPASVDLLNLIGLVLFVVATIGSVAGLVVRFRRSSGAERQQLKWFVYGAIATVSLYGGLTYSLQSRIPLFQITGYLAIPLLPGACLVAILRYRLYEIDRIINRTLVYGLLTSILVSLYSVLVVGLGALVGSDHPVVIAVSTLVVAAAFGPGRRWVQAFIDRRFYRHKYDAEQEIGNFSEGLRDEVELTLLRDRVLSLIAGTMQPAMASLWLGEPGERRADRQPPTDDSASQTA